MSQTDSGQERTEQATPKRLEQAKEKGQVPRSKELGTSMVLIFSALGMMIIGPWLADTTLSMMTNAFTLRVSDATFALGMSESLLAAVLTVLMPLLVWMLIVLIAAVLGTILVGGVTFSSEGLTPKLNKMSPLKGAKRMFGVQAAVELAKAIGKFLVVSLVAYLLLEWQFPSVMSLSMMPMPVSVKEAVSLLAWLFLGICLSTLLIVLIDVPFQIFNHQKQLKMTKQEVKDEYKDSEGKPEIKSKIRQLQREMAQKQMLSDVADADVVIVNPEHFAVALKYDLTKAKAPYVVAKGSDHFAFRIRELAMAKEIQVIRSPALSRAIFYTTKINQQIPEGLYTVVAQVLAYVYQLSQYQAGKGERPRSLPDDFSLEEPFQF